jgi:predicted RNase H-like HicB family nuclease
MTDPYDGFTINLFLDEDGDWLAHFVELPHISAFADTPEEALHELAVAWGAVKATYRDEGMPIPAAPQRARKAG